MHNQDEVEPEKWGFWNSLLAGLFIVFLVINTLLLFPVELLGSTFAGILATFPYFLVIEICLILPMIFVGRKAYLESKGLDETDVRFPRKAYK
jgi:hypothetical protein